MVKKIDSSRPVGPSQAAPIESGKAVGASKVGAVGQVTGDQSVQRTSGKRVGRRITLADREQLFRLIEEEADKMFGADKIPEKKRQTVETAAKMAVDSAMITEDEEKPKKKE